MYQVTFEKSHTNRYDDLTLMLEDIKNFLKLHPKRKVIIEKYLD